LSRTRRLRVGIDGRAFRSPAAGVRRYLQGLVPALHALDDAPELVALGGDAASIPPGVAHIDEPPHPPTNAGWTLVGIPRSAARAGVDLIHAPAYTAPFWAGVPTVVTVHDVSYELHPEWYPYRRDWLRRAFYRRSACGAAHVLTVSEFSAREIGQAYRIPRERVTVAHLGVSAAFAPVRQGLPCALPAAVRTPFLLHVGDLHQRRNLAVVVDAVLEARRHFGALPTLSLVLAGIDRGVADALCASAAEAGADEAVVPLGPVDEDELHRLYRCATALVYPSRYEGFGLPVLEAMASGTPVIASKGGSIPEVLGDAGILLDPDDDHGWTAAIVRVVNDEGLRVRMSESGLARAAGFTWSRTACTTMEVYRRVHQNRRRV
jgi:glycosyltransferase involved in cell wall biosynthesis